eukprot:SAG22_NODE_207_length_15278_cov_4.056855_10_plen_171_part_00
MVMLQIFTCMAVLTGAMFSSCRTNEQCDTPGTYCKATFCNNCGGSAGLGGPPVQIDPVTGLVFNRGVNPGTDQTALLQFDNPITAVDWTGDFNKTAAKQHCLGVELCGYWALGVNIFVYGCEETASAAVIENWCDNCVHAISGHVDSSMLFQVSCHVAFLVETNGISKSL